jgi:hypothetical protein
MDRLGLWLAGGVVLLLALVAIRDRLQRRHSIIANFPLIGRFRFWFEKVGAPLRQYIVTSNDEELAIIDGFRQRSAAEVFGYAPGWGLPPAEERRALVHLRHGSKKKAA